MLICLEMSGRSMLELFSQLLGINNNATSHVGNLPKQDSELQIQCNQADINLFADCCLMATTTSLPLPATCRPLTFPVYGHTCGQCKSAAIICDD